MVDATTGDDLNAFFETVTYALTGRPSRQAAAAQHITDWIAYRAKLDQAQPYDDTSMCGRTTQCGPSDQYDVVVTTPSGSQTQTVSGSSTTPASKAALPVADRVAWDFVWQGSPFMLKAGAVSPAYEAPGIDYLLPYWMLRYYSEVAHPALNPLPSFPVAYQ